MSRYFIHLAYSGSRYRGWQWQPDITNTIQGVLEDAIQSIFRKKITVYGCGRTDAEVHASQYFMHIDIQNDLDFDLKKRLNFILPYDIAIYDVFKVKNDQHARYDASKRTYHYHIHYHKNPFFRFSSSLYNNYNYDLEKMQEVIIFYQKQTDFRSMCKKPNQYKNTICRIDEVKLTFNKNKKTLLFEISANRFLQGMVRQLVGRMLDVGRGNLTIKELKYCFKTGIKPKITLPAHPQGLYLHKVEYPFLKLKTREIFK